MRIVSGKYKTLRIPIPKNLPVRPTTDFAREGLFNVLENELNWEQTSVLDLFSGTGFLAVECLSRGAASVTSVENHPLCVKHLISTAQNLNNNWKIVRKDAFQFIKNCEVGYSLILADPPYNHKLLETIPFIVFQNKSLLLPNALLVLEHPKQFNFTKHPNFTKQKKYGNVHFSFFINQVT